MKLLTELADVLLMRDNYRMCELVLAIMRAYPRIADIPPPAELDPRARSVAAGAVETIAGYLEQPPPAWTAHETLVIEPPLYLVPQADTGRFTRWLSDHECPEPLYRRGLRAPPGFLQHV